MKVGLNYRAWIDVTATICFCLTRHAETRVIYFWKKVRVVLVKLLERIVPSAQCSGNVPEQEWLGQNLVSQVVLKPPLKLDVKLE